MSSEFWSWSPDLVLRVVLRLVLVLVAARVLHALLQATMRLAHMHVLTRNIPGPTLSHVYRLWRVRRSPSRASDLFHEILGENRPIFKFWSGPLLMVVVMDADDIEFVLTSKDTMQKSSLYRILAAITGTGLIHLSGEDWRRRRRVVLPFMHADILRDFPAVFHHKAEIMASLMEPMARSGDTFDIQPFVGMAVNDMVCHTVMATDMHSQAKDEREFSEAMSNGLAILTYRVFHPWFLSDSLFRFCRHYGSFVHSMEVIRTFTLRLLQVKRQQRRQQPEQHAVMQPRKRPTFLDVMLDSEEGASLTDTELLNEAKTLITAASGGSTDALSFVLLCVALRQDVQERIVQELTDVFGEDLDRETTVDDIRHLEYLDRVVRETLRMFPSIPQFGRTVSADTTLPSGHRLPAGAQVFVYSPAVQMDERHYPQPELFDPERFLPERQAGRHPFSYLPFSGGPRACIGQRYAMMQIKTTVAVLLRRYRLLPADTARAPATIADIKTNLLVTQNAQGGYRLRLQPRTAASLNTPVVDKPR